MGAEADPKLGPGAVAPGGLLSLLALVFHGSALPALPPPEQAPAQQPASAPAPSATTAQPVDSLGWSWYLPPVRLGGSVSYSHRRDMFQDQTSVQSGLSTTLNASTSTYIWQPWFARVNGALGFTVANDSSGGSDSFNKSSKSVAITGSGQLSVLTQSKFPFEAFFQRNDSRVTADLVLGNAFASQRFGFTQRYIRPEGDALLGWDRSSQTSADAMRDVQDSLQLRLAHRLEHHRLQFNADRNTNKRDRSGESMAQNNLAVQHSYTPNPSISVDNLVNISRSDYQLLQGNNDARLLQLSSNAFWRPQGHPMTVTGGVRMFALETDSSGLNVSSNAPGTRLLNANANVGVNYEINRFTRLNAGANVNMTDSKGEKTISTSQTVGVGYQPESIQVGAFRYNWGTSASGSNSTGGEDSQRQLTLQLSHSLSRNFKLAGGSTLAADVSQGLSATASNAAPSSDPAATKQLTHSGSVSWDVPHQAGSALLRLSASDSRALDGRQEVFQLINLQVSSSLPTGSTSSLTGNLTLQATRQGRNARAGKTEPDKGFVTSSSGSLSYQQQRLFGVRQLRFTSDLRLSSDSLLPVFSSAQDQELAAWDNRVDYFIGRTQLRLNLQVSSHSAPHTGTDATTGLQSTDRVTQVRKSIMFSVRRNFGNF